MWNLLTGSDLNPVFPMGLLGSCMGFKNSSIIEWWFQFVWWFQATRQRFWPWAYISRTLGDLREGIVRSCMLLGTISLLSHSSRPSQMVNSLRIVQYGFKCLIELANDFGRTGWFGIILCQLFGPCRILLSGGMLQGKQEITAATRASLSVCNVQESTGLWDWIGTWDKVSEVYKYLPGTCVIS